ncbi:hypothetical protein [Bradyrhizobium sp. USDA 10063]
MARPDIYLQGMQLTIIFDGAKTLDRLFAACSSTRSTADQFTLAAAGQLGRMAMVWLGARV